MGFGVKRDFQDRARSPKKDENPAPFLHTQAHDYKFLILGFSFTLPTLEARSAQEAPWVH
ncbi:MAG: hypothetical protein Q7T81_11675 [Pseudolabrys sp.]|nr:hypothetical protein [Pseudolabrys sp.]